MGTNEQVAQAFVVARRNATALDRYPGSPPVDLPSAYDIQDHAIAIDGRPVAGWKVGRIFPPDSERLGAERLVGPIFADQIFRVAPGEEPAMPVFAGGFAAAEAEILVRVGPSRDGHVPHDDAGVRTIVEEVCLGIEIASSPYPRINADGPPVTASDFGNNAGLVIGQPLAGWSERDLNAITAVSLVNDREVGRGSVATMLDGPYGAVRFLLAHLRDRGIAAPASLWVSTGAVTGVHPVEPGDHFRASFEGLGDTCCRIVAASAS
ncbi:2-keto-4-pentenoate hydratase [Sphingomonas rosea]|uniref:2-keto-4-pentenoate hydratase n=1 Tax=Sphingomonas rosea TaxID=335605 RepID=A0ABP7U8T7_9SPHN